MTTDMLQPPQRQPITLDAYIGELEAIRESLRAAGVTEMPQVQLWSPILKRHHAVTPRIAYEFQTDDPKSAPRFWNPADDHKHSSRHKGRLVVRIA